MLVPDGSIVTDARLCRFDDHLLEVLVQTWLPLVTFCGVVHMQPLRVAQVLAIPTPPISCAVDEHLVAPS